MASKYNPQNLTDVSGLVVVITGGGSGIGLIMAQALEANGAKVFITGRRKEKLEEAAKTAAHGNIIPIQGDAKDREDLQRAVDIVTKETGYVDLLINNAGVTSRELGDETKIRAQPDKNSSISEFRDYWLNYRNPADYTNVVDINIAGVFLSSLAFLELLDAGNKRRDPRKPTSQIITVGSTGGLTRFNPSFIYNASKAGVQHLSHNLGNYLAPHKIRTNVIAPGWFPSEMTAPVIKKYEPAGGVFPATLVPQQRMGTAEEMAGTILWMAGKGGGYANGTVTIIDGGVAQVNP